MQMLIADPIVNDVNSWIEQVDERFIDRIALQKNRLAIMDSKDPKRSYVLYYQKMTQPIEAGKAVFLKLKDNPKALQATQTLRQQTGLSYERLSRCALSRIIDSFALAMPKAPSAICSVNIASKLWGIAKAKLSNSPLKIHNGKASLKNCIRIAA